MRYILFVLGCIALVLYHTPSALLPEGALSAATISVQMPVAGHIHTEGEGNFYRVVTGQGVDKQSVLELAAGSRGRIAYVRETIGDPDVVGRFRVQFLSTQGTGRVVLEALDGAQRPIASVIWLVTGSLQPADSASIVIDKRSPVNFRGDWLKDEWVVSDLLRQLTGRVPQAEKYRLSIVTGEGQHALVSDARFSSRLAGRIRITPQDAAIKTTLGSLVTIRATIENVSREALPAFQAGLWGPEAYGLIAEEQREHTVEALGPGATTQVTWTMRAQRPDLVNRGKPWPVFFTVNGQLQGASATVAVADNRPGKIFYVMTEDLEPIDSAGYSKAWGNADGWLNPDEFRVQMIEKAEKLNSIADQYGAKWTHYIAWTAVRAAEWAAGQSKKNEWLQMIQDLRHSVMTQSAGGHEYALHLHSDYDPDLAGNVLSFNPDADGFWANHRRHGWAHSVFREGDFAVFDSRTGLLYYYQRILDQLSRDSGQGQILTARVGSFDFGDGDDDEAMSSRAYRQVGLWGSSDADGNMGGVTSAPFEQEIYFARYDNINQPAETPAVAGLVEFRPTPKDMLMYDVNPATVMNAKTDQGITSFTANGQIKPGVHAIIGFTHAMFMMGEGSWHSLEGGQFRELQEHLRYITANYADKGLMRFSTASQLVAEYIDYYSCEPVAIYGAIIRQDQGEVEYAIRILGKDIPITNNQPHLLKVKLPLYLRDSAVFAQVLKNDEAIYSTWEPAKDNNDIPFIANDHNAKYTLRVYYDDELAEIKRKLQIWWNSWQ